MPAGRVALANCSSATLGRAGTVETPAGNPDACPSGPVIVRLRSHDSSGCLAPLAVLMPDASPIVHHLALTVGPGATSQAKVTLGTLSWESTQLPRTAMATLPAGTFHVPVTGLTTLTTAWYRASRSTICWKASTQPALSSRHLSSSLVTHGAPL